MRKRLVCFLITALIAWSTFSVSLVFAANITLRVASHAPHADWERKVIPLFERETGIKVEVLEFPFSGLLEKQTVETIGRTGAIDIIELYDAWIPLFIPEGHIEAIPQEWTKKMDLERDFPPVVQDLMKWKGKYYLVPETICPFTLYYRTDLFGDPKEKAAFKKAYGYELAPPKTPNQLIDIAKFFTRDTNNDGRIDQWGYSFIGQAGARMAYVYLQQVKSYGGKILDQNMRVSFANETGIKALQFFLDVLPYCPPGAKAYTWADCYESFAQGKVAMVQQWALIGQMIDVGNLPVKGKYGVASLPFTSGVKPAAMVANWFLGVSPHSKNKEAAFKLLDFLGSVRAGREAPLSGGQFPARIAVLKDSDLNKKYPWYKDVLSIFNSEDNWITPQIPEFPELSDLTSAVVHETFAGKHKPQEAVQLIKQKWEDVLGRAGYYKK
jgi:multiple sugar transport system substrate-binding protein